MAVTELTMIEIYGVYLDTWTTAWLYEERRCANILKKQKKAI